MQFIAIRADILLILQFDDIDGIGYRIIYGGKNNASVLLCIRGRVVVHISIREKTMSFIFFNNAVTELF